MTLAVTKAARLQRREAPGQPLPPDAGATPSPSLARALADARKASVPKERVHAALIVAAREAGLDCDEPRDALGDRATRIYEGELPGGVAVLARARSGDGGAAHGSAQSVRGLFQTFGGKFGKVAWLFDTEWTIVCTLHYTTEHSSLPSEQVEELVARGIDGGIDDFHVDIDKLCVRFIVDGRQRASRLKAAFVQMKGVASVWVERTMTAKNDVHVNEEQWECVKAFCDKLEAREDIVEIVHNARIEPVRK